jgi:ABC-type uncharacterized transport system permease subunit
MTATAAAGSAATRVLARTSRRRLLYIGAAAFLVVLSVVRVVTGETELTSSGTVGAALAGAVPIGLAGLGGLWAERVGIVNIGLEGMMILGTWFGAWVGYQHGPWAGVVAGAAAGAAGGLLHALATVTFGIDQIISGVAINILAEGLARYLSVIAFVGTNGGGQGQSPTIQTPIAHVSIPGLASVLTPLEKRHWFLVSDLAGILRGLLTGVSLLTVVAVGVVALSWVVLWRTPFGLRLRSSGEQPQAAESLGVRVQRVRYAGVAISGACAGLGGAFLVTVAANIYREGQTGGRGYIGLAAMIFGNWRPGGLAAGAALFGYADALKLRNAGAVHALLLLVAVLLAVIAARQAYRRRPVSAVLGVVVAAGALIAYLVSDTIDGALVSFTPHITTLLVLSLASQRLRPPAAEGVPYRRGGS